MEAYKAEDSVRPTWPREAGDDVKLGTRAWVGVPTDIAAAPTAIVFSATLIFLVFCFFLGDFCRVTFSTRVNATWEMCVKCFRR